MRTTRSRPNPRLRRGPHRAPRRPTQRAQPPPTLPHRPRDPRPTESRPTRSASSHKPTGCPRSTFNRPTLRSHPTTASTTRSNRDPRQQRPQTQQLISEHGNRKLRTTTRTRSWTPHPRTTPQRRHTHLRPMGHSPQHHDDQPPPTRRPRKSRTLPPSHPRLAHQPTLTPLQQHDSGNPLRAHSGFPLTQASEIPAIDQHRQLTISGGVARPPSAAGWRACGRARVRAASPAPSRRCSRARRTAAR